MMKHKAIITMTILILNILCLAQFAGGSGTLEDPYQIETAEQLDQVRNYMTSSFKQIADIDLGVPPWNEGSGWVGIGRYVWTDPSQSFRGNYDGGGFNILNMSTTYPPENNWAGLFGSTRGCILKNINIINFYIEVVGSTVGGLTSMSYYDTWSNIYVEGAIKGYSDMGLMSSFFEGYNITNCHAKGEIISTGGGWIGGLVANCNADSILNSSVEAKISSNKNIVGGFIAQNIDTGLIDNCFAIVDMQSGSGSSIGGFIGLSLTINRSQNISNSYSRGSVIVEADTESIRIGGFIGNVCGYDPDYVNINNCYSAVDVTGYDSVGGCFGRILREVAIVNCYSVGRVNGNSNIGGLIGYIDYPDKLIITNSYWDMETAGVDSSAAGEGRTTAEMTLPYSENTYVDWDFVNVWRDDVIFQNNGYPTFLWVSGIEDNDDSFVAGERGFELYQNYPNPFNPVTQIKFALTKTADVKLSVYNISGQKVAELANGSKQAGTHTVDFDGSKLNSGIYYYTLEVEGKAITKKMVLTK
jgi:hypothetical protein